MLEMDYKLFLQHCAKLLSFISGKSFLWFRILISVSFNFFLFLFFSGIPIKVECVKDGTTKTNALDLYLYLNEIG